MLAGCGPLLWLLAWQYLNAGVRLDAVLDTAPRANWRSALRHAASFALSPYLIKGLRLILAVRRNAQVIGNVAELEAQGSESVEAVVYRTSRGEERRLPLDMLILHQGVVPNANLALSAGVTHRWSDAQLCFIPVLDAFGSSNVPGLSIAGDGAGIAGAEAAEARGRLAAVAAIRAIKPQLVLAAEETGGTRKLAPVRARARISRCPLPAAAAVPAAARGDPGLPLRGSERKRGPRHSCTRLPRAQSNESIRALWHGPVPRPALRAYRHRDDGAGAQCLSEEIGYYRLRPPVKPITLAELAGLPSTEAAVKAVARE